MDHDAIQGDQRYGLGLCHDEASISVAYLKGSAFPVGKCRRQLSHVYKLFLKAHRVVHTEKCIYWYRVGVQILCPRFGQKRSRR